MASSAASLAAVAAAAVCWLSVIMSSGGRPLWSMTSGGSGGRSNLALTARRCGSGTSGVRGGAGSAYSSPRSPFGSKPLIACEAGLRAGGASLPARTPSPRRARARAISGERESRHIAAVAETAESSAAERKRSSISEASALPSACRIESSTRFSICSRSAAHSAASLSSLSLVRFASLRPR